MEGLSTNYEEWKHCITVKCRIVLTAGYVQGRIDELANKEAGGTVRFLQLYGVEHWRKTLEWFKQARDELATGRELVG